MNKYAPFSKNQVNFLKRVSGSWLNVAEGGKRGTKNVTLTLAFCIELEEHPDKIHLAAGVSQSTARLNIIDSNGLGMMNYFKGRCREGKYKDKNCLYVQTKTGEKVVLIAGGAKANDHAYIKGFSLGMVYITEVNECHETFVKECIDRTLASKNLKIFHDLNPKEPTHPYYSGFLDFHEEKQKNDPAYGFNYGHFNILDNMSISNKDLKKHLNKYDKNTVWYKRDILGERAVAEGLIYPTFANNHDVYIIEKVPENIRGFIQIGVDFGGNKSGHAFNATFIANSLKLVITIADYWTDEKLNAEELALKFLKFYKMVRKLYPQYQVIKVRADSAEPVLINSLQKTLIRNGLKMKINGSLKKEILGRIRFYNKLLAVKAYYVLSCCKHTINALDSAQWNDKRLFDERLDDGTSNIDTLDAQEYSTEELHKKIEKVIDYC